MKKLIIIFIGALLLTACGVGTYSISSGKSNDAAISFVSPDATPITVYIDGKEHYVETVKTKTFKRDRNIKKTAQNTITILPGQHDIKVISAGNEIYSKKLFISTAEHRIIEL